MLSKNSAKIYYDVFLWNDETLLIHSLSHQHSSYVANNLSSDIAWITFDWNAWFQNNGSGRDSSSSSSRKHVVISRTLPLLQRLLLLGFLLLTLFCLSLSRSLTIVLLTDLPTLLPYIFVCVFLSLFCLYLAVVIVVVAVVVLFIVTHSHTQKKNIRNELN